MNTIIFNGTATFGVENFNKNTSFEGETVISSGYANLIVADMDDLTAVAQDTITSIQIKHDNDVIYNSSNLTARISVINEYLNMDRMSVSVNFNF